MEARVGYAAEVFLLRRFRLDDDPVAINRLRRIGRQLIAVTERSKFSYRFSVLDTRRKNAVSLANGHVFVTRGLMELLDRDDEVAAVLAHELGHVNHRHLMARLERREKTLTQRVLLGGILGLIPVAGEKMAYLVIDQAYDHDQELEADAESVRYLRLAGYDPRAAVRLLTKLGADPELRKAESIFGNHPLWRERIQELETVAGNL